MKSKINLNEKLNNKSLRSGFSLVETLVAIAILLVTVVGPLVVVANNIMAASVAKDQVTAFYLAQEAMEMVRNVRDESSLHNTNLNDNKWLTYEYPNAGNNSFVAAGCADGVGKCRVDVLSRNISACSSDTTPSGSSVPCEVMHLKDVAGFTNGKEYGYDLASPKTSFVRYITLKDVSALGNNSEVKVTVTVTWETKALHRTAVVETYLYSWQ